MRRALIGVAVLGLLALGDAGAAAQDQVGLTPTGAPQFPQRLYRLTLPRGRALRLEDIKVAENGDPVSKLSLTSPGGSGVGQFGAIVAIDTSSSMHGAPIRSAVEAARGLARQRGANQQIGIMYFNQTVKVALAPTADQHAIDQALSQIPPLHSQTHIFDAVGTALDLLDQAHIAAGSIVVLSDGSDNGSLIASDAVSQRARKAGVTIYTVGLVSRAFDPRSLRGLADGGGGHYVGARSLSALHGIFRDIGALIASDYRVSYRSFARPGRQVTVAVRVGGIGLATSTYQVPGNATFVQVKPGFWTSNSGVLLTGMLCALLLALALTIPVAHRSRGPRLRERVRGFVSMPADASGARGTLLTGRPLSGAERSLERTQWWAAFKLDVEIARIAVEPMRIVTAAALATLVVAYLLVAVSGIALVGLFALAIPWAVRTWVRLKRQRQRSLFVEQLPEVLQGSASAIRAGHGLVAALSMVAEDSAEPSRTEFLRVVADEALGVPLDEALRVVQRRMGSRDVMQVALVAQIQREAGGNMAEVLDRITESLRQRGELRRMVQALTAQGRLSRWIVTALPLVLLLIISVLNPTYIKPLFTKPLGLVMLAVAGVLMFMGSFFIGKIVNFKV